MERRPEDGGCGAGGDDTANGSGSCLLLSSGSTCHATTSPVPRLLEFRTRDSCTPPPPPPITTPRDDATVVALGSSAAAAALVVGAAGLAVTAAVPAKTADARERGAVSASRGALACAEGFVVRGSWWCVVVREEEGAADAPAAAFLRFMSKTVRRLRVFEICTRQSTTWPSVNRLSTWITRSFGKAYNRSWRGGSRVTHTIRIQSSHIRFGCFHWMFHWKFQARMSY